MEILRIRHRWPEKAGFSLNRPDGTDDYVLLHFHTPVRILIDGHWQDTLPGAMIKAVKFSYKWADKDEDKFVNFFMKLAGKISDDYMSAGMAYSFSKNFVTWYAAKSALRFSSSLSCPMLTQTSV